MPVRIFALLLLMNLCASAQVASQPAPAAPVPVAGNLLRQAIQQAETSDPGKAIATLETLFAKHKQNDIIQLSARLLHGQLTGSFKKRQSYWMNRQVIDMAVIVPNAAAFAQATAAWTDEQFFPVLMADAWFTPMFLRAFKPQQVLVWSGDSDDFDIAAIAAEHNRKLATKPRQVPLPGIVVTHADSAQVLGALALARGRGQPLHLQPAHEGKLERADYNKVIELNAAILTAANQWRMLNPVELCGITLAGRYPYTYNQPKKPDFKRAGSRLATDDLLGREPRGLRLGVVGRLLGDDAQSVYQAMCSLFLQPKRTLLFDDYSNRKASFKGFRYDNAASILNKRLDANLIQGKQVTPVMFRKLTRTGTPYDMLWINSSGGADFWELRGRATPNDLPIDHANIYYYVHSFSAKHPSRTNTIAGRALLSGSYWFFGSCEEPYVHAFVLPTSMTNKVIAGTPLAFAARQSPGHPMYQPWRLVTLGDPLFSLREFPAKRIPPITLSNAKPLTDHNAADPQQQLRHAMWIAPEKAIRPAVACLKDATNLEPDVLARAVKLVFDLKGYRALAALDLQAVRKHDMAKILVWESLITQLDEAVKLGDIEMGKRYLRTMLSLAHERASLGSRITRLLTAAEKVSQRTSLERWLRAKEQLSLSRLGKEQIEKALSASPNK